MAKIKKTTLIGATAFVIGMLVLIFIFRGSVETLTPGYFQQHRNLESISKSYKPVQYTIDNYTVNFKVPEATEVYVSPDQGDKMRLSLYFVNSSKLAFRGYIQVWKVTDLEHFLNDSKALSPLDFKSYNLRHVQENNYQGLKTEWTADLGQNFISGTEYWLILNSEETVRVSFFTDTAQFPGELQNVTQQILNSLKIDKRN